MTPPWHIAADTGGTFTDLIGRDPQGRSHRAKVLSSACLRAQVVEDFGGGWLRLEATWDLPDDFFRGFRVKLPDDTVAVLAYRARDCALQLEGDFTVSPGDLIELSNGDEAPVLGARVMTKTPGDEPLPPIDLRLGTTRGTNALLERKGAKVALFTSKGFGDLLHIGDQRRPDLFTLNIERSAPLPKNTIEVRGRLDAAGKEISPLDLNEKFFKRLEKARAAGCATAAVALMHSYRNDAHEQALAEALREAGFELVALSSELAPFIKLLPRAQTAAVEAYLGPIMERYLDAVESALPGGRIRVMTSAGGLSMRQDFRAKDGLLSGPAGGVVGASAAGRQAGYQRIIAFDMGGTSTDVSRSEGDFDYRSSHQVGDASIIAPALKIETVAAGGGSICGWDGRKLFVGPDSAGADPGPACYGAGGPLTVTDVNLLLGRIPSRAFSIPVYPDKAEAALEVLSEQSGVEREALLAGLLQIANERMAAAIETISVREGYDPQDYALVAFGGAGGLHACAIADELGMSSVVFPPHAGVLSAYGIERSVVERIGERQVMHPLDEVGPALGSIFNELAASAREGLEKEGLSPDDLQTRQRRVTMRLAGQESALTVDFDDALGDSFRREYEQVFGYFPEGRAIEVVQVQVVVSTPTATAEDEDFSETGESFESEATTHEITRDALGAGTQVHGPAVVFDDTCTLFVDRGWQAVMGTRGTLRLKRIEARTRNEVASDAVARELFTNRFRQIVDEMGMQLERTAVSTNVKERLDFSCALLDAEGRLIANAPHIPVHLGAIGLCVRTVAKTLTLEVGDVVVTNHPGFGGSHLPDVTVITPVFFEGALVAYVANRAHHAEIGGVRPGSMPPHARNLAEEGVTIAPMYLFRRGESRLSDVESLLCNAKYPTRAIADNLADLSAQVAANRRGERQVQLLVESAGAATVSRHLKGLIEHSAEVLRTRLQEFGGKRLEAVSTLDDGAQIQVAFDFDGDSLTVDFTGTSETHPGNLNATPAIVSSALMYVLRLLIREDLPLNEGLLAPVTLKLPHCFLNPDFPDDPLDAPAVVGGNVETSQRIVECCLRALDLVADSQGTMNNLIFGDGHVSYYETIGGGAGAGEGFAGASGVHTHMTNTAITDPEILEQRYPVRLRRFALRKDSGGLGRWRGGNGLVRELEFLSPMSVSLLTQHREDGPQGCNGGGDGMVGRQRRKHVDGQTEMLPALAHYDADTGERLRIETPGGGGFGV
ncbi:MAG: hydantoinase B/oxoprolinase family protein [Puniceicoccales bacterium]